MYWLNIVSSHGTPQWSKDVSTSLSHIKSRDVSSLFASAVLDMTKVKVTKEDSGSLDFVEKRRAALER